MVNRAGNQPLQSGCSVVAFHLRITALHSRLALKAERHFDNANCRSITQLVCISSVYRMPWKSGEIYFFAIY